MMFASFFRMGFHSMKHKALPVSLASYICTLITLITLVIPKCLQFHKHIAFSHDLLALQTQGLFLKSPYFISSS